MSKYDPAGSPNPLSYFTPYIICEMLRLKGSTYFRTQRGLRLP